MEILCSLFGVYLITVFLAPQLCVGLKDWPLTYSALTDPQHCRDTTGCWCDGQGGWTTNIHPALCCHILTDHVPIITLTVQQRYRNLYNHSGCCQSFFASLTETGIQADVQGLRYAPKQDGMKMDLWATSSHKYENLLHWYVASAFEFWPFERWNSDMVIAMDAGVPEDERWCVGVSRVRCVMHEPPGPYYPDEKGSSYFFSRGLTQGTWNAFHADLDFQSPADWIAIAQPDVVFFSDFIPDLLFDWSGPTPRPIIIGATVPQFVPGVLKLGIPWVGEFMDSLPLVVKPLHLQRLREFIRNQFLSETFTEAFRKLFQSIDFESTLLGWTHTANQVVSFEAVLGNFLYAFHRDEFFWSIRDGLALGLNPDHTCPSLRAAAHFGGGRCKYDGTKRLAQRDKLVEYNLHVARLMHGGHKGFAYPPVTQEDLAVRQGLLRGDQGTWNASDQHCTNRRVESLLQTYATWETERSSYLNHEL